MAKKAAVTAAPAAAPAPSKLSAAVRKFFAGLSRDSDEATGYVCVAEPADALLRLGGHTGGAGELALPGASSSLPWEKQRHLTEVRAKMFLTGENIPPAVWVRLGEALAALRRAAGVAAPAVAGWPDWLRLVVGELFHSHGHADKKAGLAAADLAALFAEAGLGADAVVRFLTDATHRSEVQLPGYWYYGDIGQTVGGTARYLKDHLTEVRAVLAGSTAAASAVAVVQALAGLKFDFAPVLDLIADLATGPSKTVREAALPVLLADPAAARPHVEAALAKGDAGRRNEAAVALWRLGGDEVADYLRRHAEGETAERVRQTIDKLVAAPDDAAPEGAFDLPPVRVELGAVPFPEAAQARVRAYFARCFDQAMKYHEQQLAQWNGPDRPKWMSKPQKPDPIPEARLTELFAFVAGERKTLPHRPDYQRQFTHQPGVVDDSFAPPGVHLIHVVRLLYALCRFDPQRGRGAFWWNDTSDLESYRGRCPEPFGLRELDAAVATLPNGEPGMITHWYLTAHYNQPFSDWGPDAVWPAYADDTSLMRDILAGVRNDSLQSWGESARRANVFRVLATMPHLPAGFLNLLWDLALSESKTERPGAQAALRTVPGKAEKIVVALSDGKQGVRAAAAEWLGKLGDPAAGPPLKDAFRREKQEPVKGVILAALDRLGADVNEFLDRGQLSKDAAAGLKKVPPGLAWFPFDRLPPVRWQDTGEAVPAEVVKWWIVQAAQQKQPAGGPLLRRYLAMCRPADAAGLARFVLSSWIGHDTRSPSAEEASTRARADAAKSWAHYKQYPYYIEQFKSEDGYYQHLFRQYSNELIGSAIGEKGVLAVASAAGDADCVRMCEQYLKKWFGQRLAQCKVLVEVLAWLPHPTALQVLLGVANRFKTKAVQQLAAGFVQEVADREGWTIDELADRTIPDAGFGTPDGGGRAALVLDYGPRQFTVTLNDDLEPVIVGDAGKPVKALPAPAKADDEEKAKEAKKAFADAKKQVKDVVKRTTDRLYEALCTQRGWRFADWKRFLADHPIAGRLCVRLVWAAFEPGDGGRLIGGFRPLEDGSLTSETDDPVSLPDDAVVRLAHAANLPADAAAAWRQHLADYDVAPPFDQLGRPAYALPEARRKDTEVTDFRGHQTTAFGLRGRLEKLGYLRGESEDGGWYYLYKKPFPSLGLQADIEWTGSYPGASDHPAAVKSLSFTKLKPAGDAGSYWSRTPVELGKVPAVLLSECYHDLKAVAQDGPGFDPEWEKKSYY